MNWLCRIGIHDWYYLADDGVGKYDRVCLRCREVEDEATKRFATRHERMEKAREIWEQKCQNS